MRVWLLARREFAGLFATPFAWLVLAGFQFVTAWIFLGQLDGYLQLQPRLGAMPSGPGVTDLVVAPLLGSAAGILLFVTPLVTMQAISGERQRGSLELLLAAPLARYEIVIGKYLGLLLFAGLLLALLAAMPLSLLAGGPLDGGKLAAGLLGLLLLTAASVAVGLLASTLTRSPAVAAFGGFGVLLLLWLIDSGGATGGLLGELSLARHLQPFLTGLVTGVDVAYFLLLTALSLALAAYRLETERLA